MWSHGVPARHLVHAATNIAHEPELIRTLQRKIGCNAGRVQQFTNCAPSQVCYYICQDCNTAADGQANSMPVWQA